MESSIFIYVLQIKPSLALIPLYWKLWWVQKKIPANKVIKTQYKKIVRRGRSTNIIRKAMKLYFIL